MQRLLRPRTLLLREVENTLKDLEAWINKDINHFMRRLKEIMLRGTKRYAYSAAVSTCILSNDNYIAYRNYLHMTCIITKVYLGREHNLNPSSIIRKDKFHNPCV